ncbi:MAG: hypothetical protein AAFO91_14305, partial [Bacteroidota bacterium]
HTKIADRAVRSQSRKFIKHSYCHIFISYALYAFGDWDYSFAICASSSLCRDWDYSQFLHDFHDSIRVVVGDDWVGLEEQDTKGFAGTL